MRLGLGLRSSWQRVASAVYFNDGARVGFSSALNAHEQGEKAAQAVDPSGRGSHTKVERPETNAAEQIQNAGAGADAGARAADVDVALERSISLPSTAMSMLQTDQSP